ncbi:hypothetical protein N9Z13_08095, partial [Luminiphilus sp.]|nr:hypothetical protein [Luminiphilus sp.]
TFSGTFNDIQSFNKFIWRRLKSRENKGLSEYLGGLPGIEDGLDFDTDVDIFLSNLSEALLERTDDDGARVYFVFDEVDKLAEMFLGGGSGKECADKILWELRALVQNEDRVGVIFAGSEAAQALLVSNPQAAFYNSIALMPLSPFSASSPRKENRSREIVLPRALSEAFNFQKAALDHLLSVTAGIPYYMKLVSGATLAAANRRRIYPRDVDIGVEKIFSKETGIESIDTLQDPGEDELRAIGTSTVREKVLIRAVLLSVAWIRSPLSGAHVRVGELWGADSPLVVRAQLTREKIQPGVERAIQMGFLWRSKEVDHGIRFAIPLLGESLLSRFESLWPDLQRHLEEIMEETT